MSLKAFHVVFVIVSSLLTAGFGLWAIRQWSVRGDFVSGMVGIGSFVGCAVLLWYGRWFLRKLKGVSWL